MTAVKAKPRGKPFQKGRSGNPVGRPKAAKAFKITPEMLAYAKRSASPAPNPFFTTVKPPESVVGSAPTIAQDQCIGDVVSWAGGAYPAGVYGSIGYQSINYAYLSELALIPEYRKVSEIISTEMTRRWIKISAKSDDDDKTDEIKQIYDALDHFKIRDKFREAAQIDGEFGRAHLFIDLGEIQGPELITPIGNGRDGTSKTKVTKGSIKSFRTLEPYWIYPSTYNSTNPLAPDFYKPQAWLVNGQPVHRTRLLTFVGREVPDILKAAYQFGGLSLTQIVQPAVENFRRTRQSVSDLVHSFSVSGLYGNLEQVLQAGGDGLFNRVALFNQTRDNGGMMVLDKDTEQFFNVTTPLGTLDALQAQSQEQIASLAGIPLVKLTGITPSGLNNSTGEEIRVYYDWIAAYQEHLFSANLDAVMGFLQLHLFGEIDPDIVYSFEPLWAMNEKEIAEIAKIKAETAQIHIDTGVIAPEEERKRIGNNPDTDYPGLDVEDMPNLQSEEESGLVIRGEEGEANLEAERGSKA